MKFILLLLTLLFLVNPCSQLYSNTLKLGVVPQYDHRTLSSIWSPIISELKTNNLNISYVGSSSISEFEKKFNNGDFDFVYLNPYHMIVANKSQNYQPLFRDVEKELYGIIVVKKSSGIEDLAQLDKSIIAFPSPNALGASLIPRSEFKYKFNIQPEYIYVKSHDSVYLNVLLGKVIAGGGVQKTFNKQPEHIRKPLKIIYETQKVKPHPIAFHPRVSHEILKIFKNTFIHLSESDRGQEVLSAIPIKKLGAAKMTDYTPLLKMNLEKFYIK